MRIADGPARDPYSHPYPADARAAETAPQPAIPAHPAPMLVRPVFDGAPPPEAPRRAWAERVPRDWATDRATLQAALDALRRMP